MYKQVHILFSFDEDDQLMPNSALIGECETRGQNAYLEEQHDHQSALEYLESLGTSHYTEKDINECNELSFFARSPEEEANLADILVLHFFFFSVTSSDSFFPLPFLILFFIYLLYIINLFFIFLLFLVLLNLIENILFI